MSLAKKPVLVLVLGLAGCAATKVVVKTPQATGGSRADGVVELSYEYRVSERIEVQWDEGLVVARQRCQAWGYSDAEAFGGQKMACQVRNGVDCLEYLVTASYQCTGPLDTAR